ncbi:MAG: primosomal protein N' [Marinilabiliales bacterium]|nr:primosomal protein N' [Marinilabiliales bacterium]
MHNPSAQFAEIILPLPLEGYFTYLIPEEMQERIDPGMRVVVQFGPKKFYSGIVRRLVEAPPEGVQPKWIEYLLDEKAVVPPSNFQLWEWIALYYHCSMGEVLKAARPSGLKLESETRVTFNDAYEPSAGKEPTPRERLLLDYLRAKKSCTVFELSSALLKKGTLQVLKELLGKGAARVDEEIRETYKPKTETIVKLGKAMVSEEKLMRTLDLLTKIPKQREMLHLFLQENESLEALHEKAIPKKALLMKSGSTVAVLNALIKKDIFELDELAIERIGSSERATRELFPLLPAQEKALAEIRSAFRSNGVTLLHGVTSSGKTEIFIQLIQEQLLAGKQVLYLLPEIGLTTHMINRLLEVFGTRVGVYHSRFSDAERVEIWNKVLDFQPENHLPTHQLIIGTRSALFLPFTALGLIVVDEEHENSYKQQDPAPRYHARDSAVVLGNMLKIPVLLGTATPSVESYYNALHGRYGLVELNERYSQIEMPEIVTVDLKQAWKRKSMRGMLTPELYEEIRQALTNKEQVILFQNRRGFAPFIECKACGWIPKCINCDVSLTFHKNTQRLTCHYCGYSTRYPGSCPSCQSAEINNKGFGTEKIEEELTLLFPEASIERLDLDVTRSKKGFQNILHKFDRGDTDILVGTQMITKGLDFEHVRVVGILNADNLLNFPDFRSHERSFQLMTQVSGRAGRRNKRGKVIIQTAQPDHSIIARVVNNDYKGMYQQQIEERNFFNYPPFCRMIRINLKHKDIYELERIAGECATALRERFGKRVQGPVFPAINRIKLQYIQVMWLKLERSISVTSAKRQMQEMLDYVRSKDNNKSIQIQVDVDPF